MTLTDAQIKRLKAKTRVRYSATDGGGLLLDVTPTGVKSWVFRYRLDGKREKTVLGRYPDMPLKTARVMAKQALHGPAIRAHGPLEARSSLLQKSIKGGLAVTGGLNLGGSIETIFNPIAVVETAIEKGATSILMPIGSRRQLNDLQDDSAAKITIHYYLDARDALLKALAV